MKCHLPFTLFFIIALAVGYLAGYKHGHTSSPSVLPLLNTQTTSTNGQWENFIETMHSEDEMTTALSLYSLRRLERGEIQPTKEFLASRIAYFYLSYGPADHPRKQLDDAGQQLLQAIHDFSQTNAILQATLKSRAEEFSK
jgi:hypothetical protein